MHTATGHFALEWNVLRKMCDVSPASPMAWGFKVQSGFKTNEARRDSTKNAEAE